MKINITHLFFIIPLFLVAVDNDSDRLSLSLRSELVLDQENALRLAIVLLENGDINNRRGLEYIIER
ncbi:hypothetical protein [Sulfurimonas sp. HSL3-7]|uniref:hypothetical protein n=1 Tax=Sulfonitrofixus jiaomeiensis TaxID=3131938 RepID=UPI0031F7ECA3